ncbi:MAG: SpoIIE family protein phosphatase [Anaerolineaceae bacterium]|nr:SpoIIE family protein phosphatase [Anaerolineaceae bacterium]
MFNLNSIAHLAPLEALFDQLVNDRPGLILVAGADSRGLPEGSGARVLASGRGMIFRILLQRLLEAHPNMQGMIYSAGEPFKPPRELKKRLTSIKGIPAATSAALRGKAGLMALEMLSAETAEAATQAALQGVRVLAQVDTVRRGPGVARHLASLDLNEAQIGALTWVVSVLRVPALCPYCRQASPVEGKNWYKPGACARCGFTGRSGEVMVFDVFRNDPNFGDPMTQRSLLPAAEYALGLAEEGYLALEDAYDLDTMLLQDAYQALTEEENALRVGSRAMQSKMLEMEVANRILVQRTEALVSLQQINETLITLASVDEIARRVCRFAHDLCGAERAVVYLRHSWQQARVLAVLGWDGSQIGALVDASQLPVVEAGDTQPFAAVPPGLGGEDWRSIPVGLCVPLAAQGRSDGWMIIQTCHKKSFQPGEMAMLRSFANQAALAIQRMGLVEQLQAKIAALEAAQADLVVKERLERELQLAHEVQQSFLPKEFPAVPWLALAAMNFPARQVGGDFYDAIWLDDEHIGLVMADVSDKGMPAALYMALSRSLIRAEAQRELDPARVLRSVNRLLMELGDSGMFVTAVYCVIERSSGKMCYARAGHDRPVLLRGGIARELSGTGTALGVVEDERFQLKEECVQLEPGDWLVLYSDGLVDVRSQAEERFGRERLVALWAGDQSTCAADFCARTFTALTSFQAGAEQADDMTLLVAEFRPV